MMKTTTQFGLHGMLLLTVLTGGLLQAEERWPRFRGPGGSGVAEDQGVPTVCDETTRAWSVPLPGTGSSSPVVWGETLFVTGESKEDGVVRLICLDARTGAKRWARELRTGNYRTHTMNNAAASTPCVDADVVVVSWFDSKKGVAMLSAFSHGGEEQWTYEIGAFKGQHGINVQAVVEDGKVVLEHLHQDGGYVVALAAKTGKPVWKTDYPEKTEKATYTTALVRKRHGSEEKEVVVVSTSVGVRGLDFETGKEIWALPGVFKERTIVSPVDILAGSGAKDSLLTVGCKNGVFFAVRPPDARKGGGVEVAWRFGKKAPYVPTPVSDGETLYVLEDGGTLMAVDPLTGEERWKERLMANFHASPLLIGGKLYCLSREGEMFVAEVGKKFRLLSSADLKPGEEVSWADATPAVAHDSLYVRLGARLDCYRAGK